MSSDRLITIDGSQGEGGGQILRTALTLSLLTGRPFRIVKLRANRDKPGLRPQHLTAVESAARLGGEAEGARVGSRDLTFRPQPYSPRDMLLDIGTAGSTALVLHTLHLPIALKAESPIRLTLEGGTFNYRAPSYPFLAETWRWHMARMGLPIGLKMPSAGYYPRGGGKLEAWIEPGQPSAIVEVEKAPLSRIRVTAGTTNLAGRGIAERMNERVRERREEAGIEAEIEFVEAEWPGNGAGAAVAIVAEHGDRASTFVGLGERGKAAEQVADEAVEELLAFEASEGAIDPHSADQVLLPMAMAQGRSIFTVSEVTDHLRTQAQVIPMFLDRSIRIEEVGTPRVIVG
ncbi:MAG: RNA 3'-terminal phosphate cyclase [Isosphaeraceae bacterium]